MVTFISAFNRTPSWITSKSYESCAIRLARSLRQNGRALKDADLIFFIDRKHRPDNKVICKLVYDYGCMISYYNNTELPMQSDAGSWSPKIYAVKESNNILIPADTHRCWIDCDYYVNDDFSELLDIAQSAQVTAPPMNLITNFGAHPERDREMWESYYDYFELPASLEIPSVQTHVDKKMGWFYFTSSIMTWKIGIGFEQSYFDISKALFNSGLQDCQKRYTQTSVPLTILKNGYTWDVIPRHLAYLYHLNGYKLENDEKYPALIHYCCNRVTEISDKNWNVSW